MISVGDTFIDKSSGSWEGKKPVPLVVVRLYPGDGFDVVAVGEHEVDEPHPKRIFGYVEKVLEADKSIKWIRRQNNETRGSREHIGQEPGV